MPHDLLLTPQLDHQRAAQLTRLAKRLDEQLDHPTGVPQPIPQSGLLERLGTLLWEATRLEADTVRAARDEARDAERPLRLVVQGEQAQHLPWELLYHAHPDLGFVAQHPWCVVTRRLRSTGKVVVTCQYCSKQVVITIPRAYIEEDALVRGLTSRAVEG